MFSQLLCKIHSDAGPIAMRCHIQCYIVNVFNLLVDDLTEKKIEFLVAIMVKNPVTRFPPDGVSRGPAELSDPNLLLIFMSRIFLFITHHK